MAAVAVAPAAVDAGLPTLLASRRLLQSRPRDASPEPQCSPQDQEEEGRAIRVRNTFIDTAEKRSPSLERFYHEREVLTCPSSCVGRLRDAFEELEVTPLFADTPKAAGLDVVGKALPKEEDMADRGTAQAETSSLQSAPSLKQQARQQPKLGGTAAADLRPVARERERDREPAAAAAAAARVVGAGRRNTAKAAPTRPPHLEAAASSRLTRQVSFAAPTWHAGLAVCPGLVRPMPSMQVSCPTYAMAMLPAPGHVPGQMPMMAAAYGAGPAPAHHPQVLMGYAAPRMPVGMPYNGAHIAPVPVNGLLAPFAAQPCMQVAAAVRPAAAQLEAAPESRDLPSVGSAGHASGRCRPCAFFHSGRCGNGPACPFCHLCDAGERKRRRKERSDGKRGAATPQLRRGGAGAAAAGAGR